MLGYKLLNETKKPQRCEEHTTRSLLPGINVQCQPSCLCPLSLSLLPPCFSPLSLSNCLLSTHLLPHALLPFSPCSLYTSLSVRLLCRRGGSDVIMSSLHLYDGYGGLSTRHHGDVTAFLYAVSTHLSRLYITTVLVVTWCFFGETTCRSSTCFGCCMACSCVCVSRVRSWGRGL